MYSNIKSVQILVALLKEFQVKDIVLSPGGSDIPLIHSIETDDFFSCYSVVDERSAAYFAMGVSQQKNKKVACICTSGSAVCNYLPGITEAFYQNAQVIAITCDKNPYYQGQLETQKIEQSHIFNGVVKKSVCLPLVSNPDDEWLCNRLVNEALLEVNHHGNGPVHINVPIVGRTDIYDCIKLPNERKIERIEYYSIEDSFDGIIEELNTYDRIMVIIGQNISFDDNFKLVMEEFFKRFNCIFAVENISNLNCDGCIFTYPVTEISLPDSLLPDLVISIGNNLAAYGLKPYLRQNYQKVTNWYVSETGNVRDSYKSLTKIIEIAPKYFFQKIVTKTNAKINNTYFDLWQNELKKIKLPNFDFSNFYVAKKLASRIPDNSILHLAILNSTRVMQFFDISRNVKAYSNVGTLGIDGCLSTFAGQAAAAPDDFAFLLIGDLSFFYDMNAAGISSISPNVRIILLNNGGGSEFHFFMGKDKISTINDFICAKHQKVATGWAVSLGYDYYCVSNENELEQAFALLDKKTDKPIFIEVFTDLEEDAVKTKLFYNSNRNNNNSFWVTLKKTFKRVLPSNQIEKAKKIIDILRNK